MRKKFFLTSTVLVVVSSLALATYQWLAMPPLQPHFGDGKFKDISWRWPWVTSGIPVPGYTITFPKFALGDKYEAKFHLRNLPDIGRDSIVCLCINDPEGKLSNDAARERLIAQIQFDAFDESGTAVWQVNKPVAKMIWASEGGATSYGLYIDDSYLGLCKKGKYLLRVRYTPDSQLSGFQGFVYIRCGGSI